MKAMGPKQKTKSKNPMRRSVPAVSSYSDPASVNQCYRFPAWVSCLVVICMFWASPAYKILQEVSA